MVYAVEPMPPVNVVASVMVAPTTVVTPEVSPVEEGWPTGVDRKKAIFGPSISIIFPYVGTVIAKV